MEILNKQIIAQFEHKASNGLSCTGTVITTNKNELVEVRTGLVKDGDKQVGVFSYTSGRANYIAFDFADSVEVTKAAIECITAVKG